MADDFAPTKQSMTIQRYSGQVTRGVFNPAVGSKVAIVYIEASAAKAAGINDLLSQIKALAATYEVKTWTPTAEAGCKPEMVVSCIARVDAKE